MLPILQAFLSLGYCLTFFSLQDNIQHCGRKDAVEEPLDDLATSATDSTGLASPQIASVPSVTDDSTCQVTLYLLCLSVCLSIYVCLSVYLSMSVYL